MKLSDRVGWTELSGPGEETRSGSVLEFLFELSRKQPKRRLPPLRVLNDLLARGCTGGGMGGGLLWDSGAISLNETIYSDLCQEMSGDQIVENCEASTVEEWQAWCYDQDYGIDYDVHLEFLKRLRLLELARTERDDEQAHLAYLQVLTEYTNFINERLRHE